MVSFGSAAERILAADGRVTGIECDDGSRFTADVVVLAPGREGARWLDLEASRLGLTRLTNPVDVGVRVELPAAVMEHLTRVTYEPKLLYRSERFDDQVRTFCVNPHGQVVKEHLKELWTVNGHSFAKRKTENTNFALLVSTTFTEPFDEPIQYGRHIAQLANFLGKGVIIQRLGDLHKGRRSTPDRIAPGVNAPDTLLYGVEVKFYSRLFKLTHCLETEVANLFAVGDGAGVSRGLVQASATGIVAAEEILSRLA